VDETSSKDPEDDKSTSWYVPEITENLLDELAKEEPRFQQVRVKIFLILISCFHPVKSLDL
jgi:hypothetical protein